ncbi:MAG: hypothetical protein JSV04_05865, partial [Candidatus Heimdallarchaeota archaeon]
TELKFTSQRHFLRTCFDRDLTSLSSSKQREEALKWIRKLQDILNNMRSQKETINSLVYKLYKVQEEDFHLIEEM